MKICICCNNNSTSNFLWQYLISYSCKINMDFETTILPIDKIDYRFFPYDVLFISAELKCKFDGIQISKRLRKHGNDLFIVILSPCNTEIARLGYEAEITLMLEEPFIKNDLYHVMDNIIWRMSKRGDRHNRITVLCLDGLQSIHINDLTLIYSDSENRHRVLTSLNHSKKTTCSLVELYSKLPENIFVYTHRSYIVNLLKVKSYVYDCIILANGQTIPLSRSYRESFNEAINHLIET